MKVVVTIGMPGAGKSSHAEAYAKEHGFPTLETHMPLFDELKKRNLEPTQENIKQVTLKLKKISDSILTERLTEIVDEEYKDKEIVFISGIRAQSEVDFLRGKYGEDNVFVIAFLASSISRFTRHVKPKKGFDFKGETASRKSESAEKLAEDELLKNKEEFKKREQKELEWGLGDVIAQADYFVITESERYPYYSWEDSHKQFLKVMEDIRKQRS